MRHSTGKRAGVSAPASRLRRRGAGRAWTLLLLLGWLGGAGGFGFRATAATPWENRAYEVVVKLFEDGISELASREAEAFLVRYPGSEKTAEVALIAAQTNLELSRPDDAISVLSQHRNEAGALADEFLFWLAQARFQKGELGGAARGFGELLTRYPESKRRFEAAYQQAFARFKQGDFPGAIKLLQAPDGAFQRLLKEAPDNEWVLRSQLLLAEALWRQRDFPAAQKVLEQLARRPLPAGLDWQRHYLLANVQLSTGHPRLALSHATNFWTVATNVVRRDLLAQAAVLEARIHEALKQPEAAVTAYERNLAPQIPRTWRQSALQRLIDLGLSAGRKEETAARLERFIRQYPKDELLDLARLTLGELRLAAFRASRAAGQPRTNLLEQARVQFERLVRDLPRSPLAGQAWLNLGWCYWSAIPPQWAEAARAFQTAAEKLPHSLSQLEARLKWADCQFRLRRFPAAMTNYWLVATNYTDLEGLATNTVVQALYQIVQSGVEAGDLAGSAAALERLFQVAPQAEATQRAELLLGQAYDRRGQAEAAQSVFTDFLRRYTNSALVPEGRLGLARAYERARQWDTAIRAYRDWLSDYTNRAGVPTNLIAQVTFDLARITLQSGHDTNGVVLLSNFARAFAHDPNVPLAEYLLGEHYFRQGDYGKAELHFLDPSLSGSNAFRLGELPFRARLMAGRAAVARQNYRNARDHFDWIITNGPLYSAQSPVPVSVAAEAYLLRGDTFLSENPGGARNPLDSFGEAITAYTKVTQHFPTNALAPLAWGRIGDCQLQLAAQDPRRYQAAADAYRQVMNSTAPVDLRSMAEVGLAVTLEKQAPHMPEAMRPDLLNQALDHYLNVFYAKNLREGELPEAYWVKRAGLAAVDLAEKLQRTELAIGLCQRLIQELPPLRGQMEKRIARLRARAKQTQPAPSASPPSPAEG